MKSRRIIGLDVDWVKMARLQEILVNNEARMARLCRQLEQMAVLLEERDETADSDVPAPAGPEE